MISEATIGIPRMSDRWKSSTTGQFLVCDQKDVKDLQASILKAPVWQSKLSGQLGIRLARLQLRLYIGGLFDYRYGGDMLRP